MQRAVRLPRSLALLLTFTLLWNGFAHAAKPSRRLALTPAAIQPAQASSPTPPQTTAATATTAQPLGARERMQFAHNILLTPASTDPNFALSGTDTYNTVLNALNQWGRYRIVTDASEADLVLQLHGVTIASTTAPTPDNPSGDVVYASVLHLTVADPHTLSPIWEVAVPLQAALRRKSRVNNIALLGENAVSQLKLLAGDPLTRQEQAQLKAASRTHAGLFLLIAAGGAGLGLGLFFIARHAMQQNQAAFCQQHGSLPAPAPELPRIYVAHNYSGLRYTGYRHQICATGSRSAPTAEVLIPDRSFAVRNRAK